MIYYAGPTDAVEDVRAARKLRAEVAEHAASLGEIVFFPQEAFAVGTDPKRPEEIQRVNDQVLRAADAVLVDMLSPARRVGTLIELGMAVGLGIPVVVIAGFGLEHHLALHQPGVITLYAEKDADGVVDRAVREATRRSTGYRVRRLQSALLDRGSGHSMPPGGASEAEDPQTPAPAPVLEWLREPQLGTGEFDPPGRSFDGDAGFDLPIAEDTMVRPGEFVDVPHAFRAAAPPGYWLRITGRSSTLRKHGLLVNESVIDEGWRGPLFAGVRNLGDEPVLLSRGMRVAQVIPQRLDAADIETREVESLRPGDRGEQGFGSTGS